MLKFLVCDLPYPKRSLRQPCGGFIFMIKAGVVLESPAMNVVKKHQPELRFSITFRKSKIAYSFIYVMIGYISFSDKQCFQTFLPDKQSTSWNMLFKN